MKVLFLLALWLTTGHAMNLLARRLLLSEWTVYKCHFFKQFDSRREDNWRCMIYKENRDRVLKNNIRLKNNEAPFKMNVNHLSDRLKSEILNTNGVLGFHNLTTIKHKKINLKPRNEVDWRKHNCVTYVRDQGVCGSCYAITTAQVIEGHSCKHFKTVSPLSSQRFIDCSSDVKNFGCNGGLMTKSFKHVMMHNGLEEEIDYPYTGEEGTCKMNKKKFKVRVTRFVSIPPGSEDELLNAVSFIGPVAIGIDAGQPTLAPYCSGIYEDLKCSKKDVNHAVLIVGYGVENHKKYWIVKNSWGESWGEGGYFRLKRGSNECGVAQMPSYPEVAPYLENYDVDVTTPQATTTQATTTIAPTAELEINSTDYLVQKNKQ